jgi:NADPH:quinone reductase-like Zn-dependent oxidoreductase
MSTVDADELPTSMRAVLLSARGGAEAIVVGRRDTPPVGEGDALVRVHAAALTRDELDWRTDGFPAIPSYELSGVVAAVAPGVDAVSVGQPVFALTAFDRDGVAAEYAAVPAHLLAAKPDALDDVESAAVPMPSLTAWQALFVHGRLEAGQRVLITGAGGGVGQVAVQLARRAGAFVIGAASARSRDVATEAGAQLVVDPPDIASTDPADLVLDTVGGDAFVRAARAARPGGRVISIAEEPPDGVDATFFIVEPDGGQLAEIGRIVDEGALRPSVDSVFPLEDARAAFERNQSGAKRGKVVLRVVE